MPAMHLPASVTMPPGGAMPPPIPVVDIGAGGAPALLAATRDRVDALLKTARRTYTAPALRLADALCTRWLARNRTPYGDELRQVSAALDSPGALALNLSHQWACTAAAVPDGRLGGVTLLRTLDWAMAGLGAAVVVARMRGPAGEILAVTWPGYAGVLTGVAPGRFAVALNQAPVSGPGPRPLRWLGDRRRVWRSTAMPPDHLLRRVLEQAANAGEALHSLRETPVCVPCILTLAGTDPSQAWTLEKDVSGTRIRQHPAVAGNHWRGDIPCHPRGRDSRGRVRALSADVVAAAPDPDAPFAWLKPPVLWSATRLAVEANAATGLLRVLGLEGARAVTAPLTLHEPPSGANR